MLSVPRGAALYVGALIGPGLLLIPALAYQLAGPASILAWLAVLVLSVPVALVFGALAIRHPVAGGVAAYAREGFGAPAAAITGIWFIMAVVLGGPAVVLVGGYYVAEVTGSDRATAVAVAAVMYAVVLITNAWGLAVSSRAQFVLSSLLVATVVVAILIGLSHRDPGAWTPFAPHGWWSIGTATNVLLWLVIGWEAMAQLAGQFRNPRRDVPRAIAVAFGVIVVLYAGLAVATVVAPGPAGSQVPLADLVQRGFGDAGRAATAALAVVLAMGTVNVYTGSVSALASALAVEGVLPRWVVGARHTAGSVSRRPLAIMAVTGAVLLTALVAGALGTTELVRATSACFVAVYLVALLAAVRVLDGATRVAAAVAVTLAAVVAAFSAGYLLVPAVAAAVVLATMSRRSRSESRDVALR